MLRSNPGYRTVIIGLCLGLINTVIHLAFYHNLEYHRDELLYFSLGMHPAVGYATVPPMIGWLAALMQFIFGYSLFAVKLFPALLSGFFTLLCVLITRELGGKTFAQILTGITLLLMPFTLRTFYLFQPVAPDLTFWTLLIYLAIRYLNSMKDKYLILIGGLSGLAMLNKYLVALLIVSLLISCLIAGHREIFRKKALYLGFFIGFMIFLPNLAWQISRGLPVVHHLQELNDTQLVYVKHADFIIDQIMMPMSGSLLMIPGLIWIMMDKKYRLVGMTAILVIFILFILRGKSYYTIGVMPMMVAAGAVVVEKYIRRNFYRYALVVFLVIISIPVFPAGIPVFGREGLVQYFKYQEDHFGITAGRRWEDGSIHSLPQDYADQLGWEEMTRLASEAWQIIPDKSRGMIYCENYGEAGAISIIGKKYGLPEAISFHESFRYWIPKKFDPDIEYLVYINWDMGDDVGESFRDIQIIGSVSDPHAREYGSTIYLCSAPIRSFNGLWKEALINLGIDPE